MENESKDIRYQLEQGYKLQTLMHRVNRETLKEQHRKQKTGKAKGVDKMTKEEYEAKLDERIEDLVTRMKKFSYRPNPVRRTYIPKANGKMRPLGIPSYEDKLVQGAMADILNEIYENIFLDCSYGFRKNRNCHQAIEKINQTIMTKKVNYIVDADIKGFFDNVNHKWLINMLKETIEDKNFIRYIERFLKSGIMENLEFHESDKGTPQGGLISPILANVYLHYVLDLWVEKYIKPRCKGEVYLIRYADDFLVMFQNENEARAFMKILPKRFAKFGLELEMSKSRILPFGRFKGTKESFDFLGFTFYNGKTLNGKYRTVIRTSKKKMRQKKENAKLWLKEHMHDNIYDVLEILKLKLTGHYRYYGVNGNFLSLLKFYKYVKYRYFRVLQRRGQKHPIPWNVFNQIWEAMSMPIPKIYVNIW